MRIMARQNRRTFYAEEVPGHGFVLSAQEFARAGRRPINVYDSRQELEQAVAERGGEVVWSEN